MSSGHTNLLTLHEAIAVVLLSKSDRTATYDEISFNITKRGLFYRPTDGEPPPPDQIRRRTYPTTKSGRKYSHLFEYIEPDKVKLK